MRSGKAVSIIRQRKILLRAVVRQDQAPATQRASRARYCGTMAPGSWPQFKVCICKSRVEKPMGMCHFTCRYMHHAPGAVVLQYWAQEELGGSGAAESSQLCERVARKSKLQL